MPGKIKVKVLAGRNLPVMDRASETTDAFVEIRFGGVTHKTDVCRKSLNPQWNSTEWYRFEVDESELQDEPLQLRVMDHDTYSANDAIGKVVISLAPLLSREPAPSTKPVPGSHPGAVMSGWIPVFDTMHGIRGELNVIVKVELFADFNKYKTSSCGVQFFHCPTIPPGHKATAIHGFVEELVVNDDPEYQWIDKIRTPRASNEARQAAFIKLSNQVQRLVGLKASELGANAVVGYQQAFDLEGEAGVVARAIGTAISIEPLPTPSQPITIPPYSQQEKEVDKEKGSPKHSRHESYGGRDPLGTLQNSSLNASSTPVGIHRRSSDSDLSVTPKGSGQTASVGNAGGAILKPSMNSNNIDMLEYPFLTMAEYPPGFIVHLAGCVFSRSVKLVDGGGEAATRAAWWTELRTEIRSHMRALRCNAVLAYSETTAICEDVCVLSASGTAAVINLDCDFGADVDNEECASAHVPYSVTGGTYCPELPPCSVCGRPQVPRVLLVGVSRPAALLAAPVANTISAVVSRVRRTPPQSEPGARDISDQLPFLEYELHKLLLSKLRMQGANAIFNLQTQIAVGERCVAALASGTAVRLNALPAPTPPRIKLLDNDKDALELQKSLWETFSANKTANGYDAIIPEYKTNGVLPEVENEDNPSLELCADKDACVLELDEAEEIETARSLCHRRSYLPVLTAHPSIKVLPKASPYAFAQVWRGRFQGNTLSAEKHVARALDGVHYKLRTLKPCALTPTRFQIELAEDEIQLVLTGAAFPLLDPNKPEHRKIIADDLNRINKAKTTQPNSELGQGDEDEIFTLDVEQSPVIKNNVAENVDDKILNSNQVPLSVSLSPMGATGGRVRHVCALRLLFVRESTAVRELGGLSGFLHTAMSEVLAIVRAYTTALGGNTLTSFYITQLMLQDNAHKNQGQCLLSVGGDVVHLTY